MSRKKKSLALLAVILAMLAIMLALFQFNVTQNTAASGDSDTQPQNDVPETPKGPALVVPENPIGIIGSLTAFAAGFAMFAKVKKR